MGTIDRGIKNVQSSMKAEETQTELHKMEKGEKRKFREEIEMDNLHAKGGERDWQRWKQLKNYLTEAYKQEEEFWSRKARVKWLSEGDNNSRYFHAVTAKRRKMNRIDQLTTDEGT